MKASCRKNQGFTLIEIIIVVLVLGILASFAVPSFSGYAKESRREDAKQLLMFNAQRLQRCFTLQGVYNSSNCVLRSNSGEGFYTLSSTLNDTTFSLTAMPVAGTSQASDDGCTTFLYNHIGQKDATGSDAEKCW